VSKDDSPILLQRHCEAYFQVRATGVPGEIKGPGLEEVARAAREFLGRGRAWVDLHMGYSGQAANEQARGTAGKATKRIASWEVFERDLVFCPAGRSKLDPKWYMLAEEAQS
jgi:hypothetical protein